MTLAFKADSPQVEGGIIINRPGISGRPVYDVD